MLDSQTIARPTENVKFERKIENILLRPMI